jgi:hypothetical protein
MPLAVAHRVSDLRWCDGGAERQRTDFWNFSRNSWACSFCARLAADCMTLCAASTGSKMCWAPLAAMARGMPGRWWGRGCSGGVEGRVEAKVLRREAAGRELRRLHARGAPVVGGGEG